MRSEDPLLLALKVLHQPERVLIRDGSAEFPSQLPFHPAQEVELGVVGLIDPVAGRFGDLVLVQGRNQLRRYQDDRLCLNGLDVIGAEPGPHQREITETGDPNRGGGGQELDQAGDGQGLSLSELDYGPGAPLVDRRDRTAVDCGSLGEFNWLMTGSTSRRITSLGRIWGMKFRMVPNRRNWIVTTAVPPGIDELGGRGRGNSRRSGMRGLTVQGHQVRLGRILAKALLPGHR